MSPFSFSICTFCFSQSEHDGFEEPAFGHRLGLPLLDERLVDTVEVGLIPVMLGKGIPLIAEGERSPALELVESKPLDSGIVMLNYRIGCK